MKKVIFLVLTIFSLNTSASSFKNEKEIRAFTDNMMMKIVKEEFDQAFNSVKDYWPMPAVEIDGVVNTIKQQWPIINQRFGNPTGIEFIKEERIGESFLRYYYLHKFTNHAIYWRMDFYKPVNEWRFNSVTFLDTLDTLYE